MNPYDLSKIRHVKAGDPVAEQPTAQPTRALELRLQQLEQQLTTVLQSGEIGSLIIRDVAVNTGLEAVSVDDVVYFNAGTGLYEKAKAGLTFDEVKYQSNPSALMIGVCVALNNGKGDIMIGGYRAWRSPEQANNMMESTESYSAGSVYYLSDKEPGKVTRFAPALRMQVFVGTDSHMILLPQHATPEAMDLLSTVSLGMRPVGGLRLLPPDFNRVAIVGFDGLELLDPVNQVWQLTEYSDQPDIAQFGWMVADASVSTTLETSIFVRIQVEVGGQITVFSASTLANLYSGGSYFNQVTNLTALAPTTAEVSRAYTLRRSATDVASVGTLYFKFVSDDTSVRRDIVFRVPESFQGWKMLNAPTAPVAEAIVTGGALTAISMVERSFGYLQAPKVVITGTGDITEVAEAVAVLDEVGSIQRVDIVHPGAGYTTAAVSFVACLKSVTVLNGGEGAAVTLAETDGGISTAVVEAAGDGYVEPPTIQVADVGGYAAFLTTSVKAGEVSGVSIEDAGMSYQSPTAIVRPAGAAGYVKTRSGLFQAVVTGGVVTSINVLNDPSVGFAGGWGYPINPKVTLLGGTPTQPAVASAVVDSASGRVLSFSIDQGGSGYTAVPVVLVSEATPLPVFAGALYDEAPVASLELANQGVFYVRVRCSGYSYHSTSTVEFVGGLDTGGVAATGQLEIAASSGKIVGVKLLTRGSGYLFPPTLVITDPGGFGNGFIGQVVLDTWPTRANIIEPGSELDRVPSVGAGVPLAGIDVELAGSGYTSTPSVVIAPPDLPAEQGGVTAEAVAFMGMHLKRVRIIAAGTGYTNPVATITGTGSGAVIALATDATGAIVVADILDPGYAFTEPPSITVAGGGGTGAVLVAELEGGTDQVSRIVLTKAGRGYVTRPVLAVSSPASGVRAVGQAKLLGEGSRLESSIYGQGGLRIGKSQVTEVNRLQMFDWASDSGQTEIKLPQGTAFYYNRKAHPEFRDRWPSVPVRKSVLVVNGTDLVATEYDSLSGVLLNPSADVIFDPGTVFWLNNDASGCPWDQRYQMLVKENADLTGDDALIPDTGLLGDEANWWYWWERVSRFTMCQNNGRLHVNQASRFHQSARVLSIGALAPVRIIDQATGATAKQDGTPQTGQLLLTVDNQVNLLTGTQQQIDTTRANNLVVIFQNNTGRPVMISSVILRVVYQKNGVGVPSVDDAALVTVGTQEGGYRNIIGTVPAGTTSPTGVSTRLYALNRAKELTPDANESAPLIQPTESVYLRVDYPVNTTVIINQVIVATIKGHIL